MKHRKELSV